MSNFIYCSLLLHLFYDLLFYVCKYLQITEVSLGEEHVSRTNVTDVQAQVESLQHAALVAWQLRTKRQVPNDDLKDEALNIQLHRPGEETPRYTLHVADRAPSSKHVTYKFAAFVVPQGR
jgi:hypothetical protein